MAEQEADLETLLDEVSEDALVADLCRESFYTFFLEFWETIEAVDLVPNWHIEFLCDQLQDVYELWARKEPQPDVLINVPPGTSKSTTVTQLFPAWLWLKAPSTRIISSSFASSLSVGHSVKSRDCVSSPKFQRLFPDLIEAKDDQDGKTDYRNTRGGQRFSTSTSGAVTGNHADFILIDDPLNPQAAASEASRLAAQEHLKTLSTRKTTKGRTVSIMVMQRVHELDPAGLWLASGKSLRHICLPGELTKDPKTELVGSQVRPAYLKEHYTDGLLDVNRLDRIALGELKLALGSYGYAGQVQQLPAPEEGGILKKAWFGSIRWPEFLAKHPGQLPWLFDADTAYTSDQANDPSALLASVYLGQTLYVRHVLEMWLEMPELKKALPIALEAHGYTPASKLYVEPKASGKTVVQELRSISQLNVIEAPTPTGSKLERVNASSPFIEAGRVVLVEGPWNEAFISQCSSFPNAAHDDMLDCLCQAIARVQQPVLQRPTVRQFGPPRPRRFTGRDYS
jgi:predicted phage terminase large subunit-like protein